MPALSRPPAQLRRGDEASRYTITRETIQATHAYNQTEEFKSKYCRRALVERKISELLFRHGLRFGHYIGRQKIRLQALWTAMVVNLKRLAKLLKKDGKTLEEALVRVKG